MTKGIQRRLAAVLAADVAGYSRLMGEDEGGTLSALRHLRTKLFVPTVDQHEGEVVKSMGDGWLVEFASVANAVNCAIEIQEKLADDETIKLRVGVHLGDITHEEEDIFGDGVNIAARLQEIAQPGGIVISDIARRSVDGKLAAAFIDLGVHSLKNISEPVTAYGWGMTADTIMASEKLVPLPDNPSIAVLPFDNLSGDPEQEYFADGIAEDIITALSKFSWFFVTARNSSFTYKGTAVDIKKVGQELGVRYVLEGSIRRGGNRIRITAQLTDAASGNHIWAERFDRELDDIFELQDEITLTIAAAVEPELAGSEQKRALRKPTENLQAWDLYHRGLAAIWRADKESMATGVDFMNQALALDPNLGHAYAQIAFVKYFDVILPRTGDRAKSLQEGLTAARKALAIDHRDYTAHYVLGRLHSSNGEHLIAIREFETAININPNFAHGHFGLAVAHLFNGQAKESLELLDLAIRLSPNDPLIWATLFYKGLAHSALQDYEKGIGYMEESCSFPSVQAIPFAFLAALYAIVGRQTEAELAMDRARHLQPNLSLRHMSDFMGMGKEKSLEFYFEGFRKAGLV